MEYDIATATGEKALLKLRSLVNEKIYEGWNPQGGVSVVETNTFYRATQALIKDQ